MTASVDIFYWCHLVDYWQEDPRLFHETPVSRAMDYSGSRSHVFVTTPAGVGTTPRRT